MEMSKEENKKPNKTKRIENDGGFRMMRKRLEPMLGSCTCNSYSPWSG
jgi:hypothetical protein